MNTPNRSANMPWKILNHPDKLFSEVTVRQMTEEERKKYGEPNKNTKKIGVDEYMKKLNITTEQLLEDCREHGTSWGAAKVIAEKHGMTRNQIYNLIKNRKIREKLTEEQKKEEEKWWSDLEDFIKDLKELQQMEIADEEKGIAMGANNDSVCRICGRENCDRG